MEERRSIEVIAAELADAEKRLEKDPKNVVLLRIVRNRLEERGMYLFSKGDMHVKLLVNINTWKMLLSGEYLPVLDGKVCTIMSAVDVAEAERAGIIGRVRRKLKPKKR